MFVCPSVYLSLFCLVSTCLSIYSAFYLFIYLPFSQSLFCYHLITIFLPVCLFASLSRNISLFVFFFSSFLSSSSVASSSFSFISSFSYHYCFSCFSLYPTSSCTILTSIFPFIKNGLSCVRAVPYFSFP